MIHPYRKDLQGDITGIVSGDTGELLVSYRYDAWGKVTVTDEANTTESAELMERNCLLYRGCFYDHETGLYYLQSRYYDPEVGRFINADSMVSTQQGILSENIFAYCENDPVNRVDPNGYLPIRMYSVMMTDGSGGRNPVSNTTASNTRDVTQEVDHALQEYVKLGNSLSQLVLPAPGPVLREAAKY